MGSQIGECKVQILIIRKIELGKNLLQEFVNKLINYSVETINTVNEKITSHEIASLRHKTRSLESEDFKNPQNLMNGPLTNSWFKI